jgi:predicted DCC family thiol-disulfide oxidoreductase YuxK
VTVFYDGACPLCSAEISFYRRRRGADRVGWVDVSACPAENVTAGLTRDQALRRFHVQDADGRLISGGRAFAVLWTALPGYAWIGRLFRLRPLAWAIDRAYDGFLKWRPGPDEKSVTRATHGGKSHFSRHRQLQLVEATQVQARSGFSPQAVKAERLAMVMHEEVADLWC